MKYIDEKILIDYLDFENPYIAIISQALQHDKMIAHTFLRAYITLPLSLLLPIFFGIRLFYIDEEKRNLWIHWYYIQFWRTKFIVAVLGFSFLVLFSLFVGIHDEPECQVMLIDIISLEMAIITIVSIYIIAFFMYRFKK